MKLKNNIKKLRIENGLTQQQLADAVGVSRQTISGIECGSNEPTAKLALKICMAFDVKFEKLFYLEEDSHAY